MYYDDLALCRYHKGPLDADSWRVPLHAIGWLESGHTFDLGTAPIGLGQRLDAMIDSAERVFAQYHFRGLHDCTLCSPGPGARLPRSHINLLVPSKRAVFACPAGIVHYLSAHSYLPPAVFIEAVFDCPAYGSQQYLESLRQANGGHPVPLMPWDKYLIEERKRTNELIERRKTALDKEPKG